MLKNKALELNVDEHVEFHENVMYRSVPLTFHSLSYVKAAKLTNLSLEEEVNYMFLLNAHLYFSRWLII